MNEQLKRYLEVRNIDPNLVQNDPTLLNKYTQELIALNQLELEQGVSSGRNRREQKRFNKEFEGVNFTTSFSESLVPQTNEDILPRPTESFSVDGLQPEALGNEINIDPSTSVFSNFNDFAQPNQITVPESVNQPVIPSNNEVTPSNTVSNRFTVTGDLTDNTDPRFQNSEETRQLGIEEDNRDKNLSDVALLSNIFGAGVSLDSAAFSLGSSIGYEGDKKGANLARGIGSASKLLFGAARQGLSGFANTNRNNYLSEFYANQSRTARQGQFIGQPQFRENQGGLPFEDGGKIERKSAPRYEDGGEIVVGDYVSFTDEKGNKKEGKIKKIENGQIFL